MQKLLLQSNLDLLRAIQISEKLLNQKQVLKEAELYKRWLLDALANVKGGIEQNLNWLKLDLTSIYPEILNRTQEQSRNYKFIVSKLMPSVYRHRNEDKLCLKVLNWLHDQHAQTRGKPFAISDGGFAIYPDRYIPIIYFIPVSSQHSLLFLPLFFHEFGHYLYRYHKDEMDDLVKEFQEKLEDHLEPSFEQNDEQSQKDKEKIRIIVETWYEWAQELYCDAVGLHIGGVSYLKAFSYHLRMSGRGAFQQKESDLERSSHPVLWLRVMFLAHRARTLNLIEEADQIENDWSLIAQILGVTQDYYGYYADQYYQDVVQMIDDMLIETSPISFDKFDQITQYDPSNNNYIQLFNLSWRKYEVDLEKYNKWENDIIDLIAPQAQN